MKIALIVITALALGHTLQSAYAAEHQHWEYKGEHGAAKWGDISPEFAPCKLGKEQSPIDIKSAEKADLKPIEFNYKDSAVTVLNNGHTIQFNYDKGSFIKVGDDQYELIQFHFHTPSEEKINGKPYSMVAHLVHKNAEGKLAVVGVLMQEGKQENKFLKSLWSELPAQQSEPKVLANKTTNIAQFLPAKNAYYTFNGSLTTPPCSEGVRWFVLKEPVQISAEQHAAFQKIFPLNARPVQPLNGRKVQESQ